MFLVALKLLAIAVPVLLPSAFVFSSAVTSENIVLLTNQARKAAGLSPLRANALLTNAAQAKAQDMLALGYFAHTSPAGKTAWDFIRQAGYRYLYSGENLAVHYSTAEDVQGAWMLSPAHRTNVVNPRFEDIGVGVVSGNFEGTSTLVVVQLFGAPESKAEARPAAVLPKKVTAPPTKLLPTVQDVKPEGQDLPLPTVEIFSEGVSNDADLQRGVRVIYLFAIAFILFAMFTSITVHYRMRHASQLAHGMAVIGLAVALLMV